MSRFFKSAAFPILIVVVLAFFAQRLISPGTQEQPPSYGDFIQQLQAGQVKTADLKTKDNTITVKLDNGQQYETGYPPEYLIVHAETMRLALRQVIGQDPDIKILVLAAGRVQQYGPAGQVMKTMQQQAQALLGEKAA